MKIDTISNNSFLSEKFSKNMQKIPNDINTKVSNAKNLSQDSNTEDVAKLNKFSYFKMKITEIQQQIYSIQEEISMNQFQLNALDNMPTQEESSWKDYLLQSMDKKLFKKGVVIPASITLDEYKDSIIKNNSALMRDIKSLSIQTENIIASQLLVDQNDIKNLTETLVREIPNWNVLSGAESFQNINSKNVISLIE